MKAAVYRSFGAADVVSAEEVRPAGEKRRDLAFIREVTEKGALVPVVDSCFPLSRIADAYRHVDSGHKRGNVVASPLCPLCRNLQLRHSGRHS